MASPLTAVRTGLGYAELTNKEVMIYDPGVGYGCTELYCECMEVILNRDNDKLH